MKTLSFIGLAAALFAAPAQAQEYSTSTMRQIGMEESFTLALAKSETLAQQGEGIAALEAAERLIQSSFRPTASLNGSQFWQDTGKSGSNPPNKTNLYVNGHYEAYSGMRDYLNARSAGEQTGAARLNLARAKQSLYMNVANAYLNLLVQQKQIVVRQAQLAITQNRIKELLSRERIGRSRKSEVIAAESQLAQDESQLQDTLGQERFAQHALKFLTGLETDLSPLPVTRPPAPPIDDFLARLPSRPDIAALRKNIAAQILQEDIQRRMLWPTLALDGNYYAKRPDSLSGIRWDFTASVQVPLYTGGEVDAKVSQLQAGRRSSELALRLAERQAQTDVRQNYDNLVYSLSTEKALEKALTLAEENGKAQAADYKYGLVTNLDVLNALDTLQTTRLQLEQAHAETYRAYVALDVAAGGPAAQEKK